MKRQLPLYITFITGLAMLIQFYMPKIEFVGDIFQKWYAIIVVFAYILGAGSLILVNGQKILKASPGWGYNLVLLIGLFGMFFIGIFFGISKGPFNFLFNYVFTPLSATMFSLLAFFIASAAFRAFKAKTPEATLLLLTAFIVMIGRVPIGEVIWSHIPFLSQWSLNDLIERWIMGAFNTAGQRAILLGASIGLISVSLKILLGIERGYLGGE